MFAFKFKIGFIVIESRIAFDEGEGLFRMTIFTAMAKFIVMGILMAWRTIFVIQTLKLLEFLIVQC